MYLAVDFLFVKDIRDKSFEILTVMDMATLFHLAVRVARSGAYEAFEAFRMLWLNWAGPPWSKSFLTLTRGSWASSGSSANASTST